MVSFYPLRCNQAQKPYHYDGSFGRSTGHWKSCHWTRDEPWRNLTYFWSAVNKRPPSRNFFDPKGKKSKKLEFLGEIFQTQTQTKGDWPNPIRVKYFSLNHLIKYFWPGPITKIDQVIKTALDQKGIHVIKDKNTEKEEDNKKDSVKNIQKRNAHHPSSGLSYRPGTIRPKETWNAGIVKRWITFIWTVISLYN